MSIRFSTVGARSSAHKYLRRPRTSGGSAANQPPALARIRSSATLASQHTKPAIAHALVGSFAAARHRTDGLGAATHRRPCSRLPVRSPPARFSMEPKPQARATSAIEIQKPGLVSSSVSMRPMLVIWPARSMPSVSSSSRPTPGPAATPAPRLPPAYPAGTCTCAGCV